MSNEEQQKAMMNGKWKHAPKTKPSNKKQQRAFFILIFIHLLHFWTNGRWLTSRAMKNLQRATQSSKKLRRTTKSKNGHRSWKNQNGQSKIKTKKGERGNQA